MALDRAALECDGYVHPGHWSSESYYTEAAKEAAWRQADEAGGKAHQAYQAYRLLNLSQPFTRRDVLRAFRKRSLKLHPDAGGDAAQFRALVAEKEAALHGAA